MTEQEKAALVGLCRGKVKPTRYLITKRKNDMHYVVIAAVVMCLTGCITKVEVHAGAKQPVTCEVK